MTSYTEQNVAAASEFAQKLTQAKDFPRLLADSGRVHADAIAFSERAKDLGVAAIWVLKSYVASVTCDRMVWMRVLL